MLLRLALAPSTTLIKKKLSSIASIVSTIPNSTVWTKLSKVTGMLAAVGVQYNGLSDFAILSPLTSVKSLLVI